MSGTGRAVAGTAAASAVSAVTGKEMAGKEMAGKEMTGKEGAGPVRPRVVRARDERGDAVVVWCLLIAMMLLPLGGVSIDLWHGIAVQRELQSAAEDAAVAGASGIDIGEYRQSGCITLDPLQALPLAEANIAAQTGLGPLAGTDIVVSYDRRTISVRLQEDVRLTLLSWVEGSKPLVVVATASSGPEGSVSGSGCA